MVDSFRKIACILLLSGGLYCFAQPVSNNTNLVIPENSVSLSSNLSSASFPRLLPDNQVIFKVYAPEVESFKLVMNGTYELTKDNDGVWSLITDPIEPGFHYYYYNMDGVDVSDPSSKVYYGFSRYSSGIEIPEKGVDFYDVKDVAHGEIRSVYYLSENIGEWRHLNIYVPYGYDRSDKKYPVLYLQHGGGENEQSWVDQGKTATILDNLIAEGKAKEMLVVMSDGTMPVAAYNMDSMQSFKSEMIDNIIPFIEENYRVIPDRENRALAGLSMGGGQSFYVGLGNPDYFSHVGIFSSGVFGGIPNVLSFDAEKEMPGIYSNTESFNSNFKVFYISCGKSDQRIEDVKNIVQVFRSHGLNPVLSTFPGGHEWQPWRKSLHDFAQLLFKG